MRLYQDTIQRIEASSTERSSIIRSALRDCLNALNFHASCQTKETSEHLYFALYLLNTGATSLSRMLSHPLSAVSGHIIPPNDPARSSLIRATIYVFGHRDTSVKEHLLATQCLSTFLLSLSPLHASEMLDRLWPIVDRRLQSDQEPQYHFITLNFVASILSLPSYPFGQHIERLLAFILRIIASPEHDAQSPVASLQQKALSLLSRFADVITPDHVKHLLPYLLLDHTRRLAQHLMFQYTIAHKFSEPNYVKHIFRTPVAVNLLTFSRTKELPSSLKARVMDSVLSELHHTTPQISSANLYDLCKAYASQYLAVVSMSPAMLAVLRARLYTQRPNDIYVLLACVNALPRNTWANAFEEEEMGIILSQVHSLDDLIRLQTLRLLSSIDPDLLTAYIESLLRQTIGNSLQEGQDEEEIIYRLLDVHRAITHDHQAYFDILCQADLERAETVSERILIDISALKVQDVDDETAIFCRQLCTAICNQLPVNRFSSAQGAMILHLAALHSTSLETGRFKLLTDALVSSLEISFDFQQVFTVLYLARVAHMPVPSGLRIVVKRMQKSMPSPSSDQVSLVKSRSG